MVEKIKDTLDKIRKADKDKPRKKIAILGAGMAGLTAAYELMELGHQVVIFEAQERVGGRAWTHRFNDNDLSEDKQQYHELGAMRFPIHHDHTRYYAKICNIKFRPFINHHDDEDSFYFIKNILTKHKDAPIKLLPDLNLPEADLKIILDSLIPLDGAPHKVLLNLIAFPMELLLEEVLNNQFDLDALLGLGPMTERIRDLDQITLGNYLASFYKSTDTLDIIGTATGLEVWWHKAVTMFLREDAIAKVRIKVQEIPTEEADFIDEIVGGTDLLPQRLYEKVMAKGVEVHFKHEVFSINNQRGQIQLGIKDASGEKFLLDFEFVLCTIPFPVLRKMKLRGISQGKQRAIRNLSYASSIKVLLYCKRRFWEEEKYNIMGGASQTDLIVRQVFYPSDNASIKRTSDTESPVKTITAQFQTFESKSIISNKVTAGPGVLVGSYCWDADARRLGLLSKDERARVVIEAISNIHPEILEEGMVKAHESMYWDEFPWAGGAFCFMMPGDFTNYYLDAIKPENKLFFAGEHCSLDNAWIQGAIISSLNSVLKLVMK